MSGSDQTYLCFLTRLRSSQLAQLHRLSSINWNFVGRKLSSLHSGEMRSAVA